MSNHSIVDRLDLLESRLAICDLALRYCRAVDERDVSLLGQLFTSHAGLRHADGSVDAIGRPDIESFFRMRFATMPVSHHYVNGHEVIFVSTDTATGIVQTHAEIAIAGDCMMSAIQYNDDYLRENGDWRFARRELRFWYSLPSSSFAAQYGQRLRKVWEGVARPAELPEADVSWPSDESRARQ
jgi:hypothetical protein